MWEACQPRESPEKVCRLTMIIHPCHSTTSSESFCDVARAGLLTPTLQIKNGFTTRLGELGLK